MTKELNRLLTHLEAKELESIVVFGNKSLSLRLDSLSINPSLLIDMELVAGEGGASKAPDLQEYKKAISEAKKIICFECHESFVQELLYLVNPFTTLVLLGAEKIVFNPIDLYHTIHFKNLILVFESE